MQIIFGAKFLTMVGIDIKYSTGKMEWCNNTLSMREPWDINIKEYIQTCDDYLIQHDDKIFGKDWLDSYAIEKILDSKYDKLDIREVTFKQNHLNDEQKQDLENLFQNCERSFNSTLGLYLYKKASINMQNQCINLHAPFKISTLIL